MDMLVVYDNRGPAMEGLAQGVAEGAKTVEGTEVWVRTLEEATMEDLLDSDAIVLGSPNWSGISARMKEWLDQAGDLWESGGLVGRVGAAFTSGRSRGAGNEMTLLALLHVMVSYGMIFVGLPWSEGMRVSPSSYYGAVSAGAVTGEDLVQARNLGRRVAEVAKRLDLKTAGPV